MAAKRSASAQLTSDNWQREDDEEEEPVSKGFAKAPKEELQKRQMKTAKRTLTNGSGGGLQTGGKLAIDLTGGLMSSFGTSKGGVSLGGGVALGSGSMSFGGGVSLGGPLVGSTNTQSFPAPIVSPHQKNTNSKYIHRLCSLNESVSRWISDHVKKNPCLDLSPVFEDYKKYLAELDAEREKEESSSSVTMTVNKSSDVAMETAKGNDSDKTEEKGDNEEEKESGDENDQPESSGGDNEKKEGQLQLAPTTTLPPGCLMAVRSKLYYKKEGQYVELGIGKLQVEEIEKEEKSVRLLMRNDTTMGQILLNVRLSASVPMTLQKNNLLIVCSPNPPLENKSPEKKDTPTAPPLPVTYVIRVKDVHLAKELHDTINGKL